jgi:hypothetical protein
MESGEEEKVPYLDGEKASEKTSAPGGCAYQPLAFEPASSDIQILLP